MRNLVLSIILFGFLFPLQVIAQKNLDDGINDLTQQITAEMTKNDKYVVAVVEFSDLQGQVTDFGRLISEELITQLYKTNKFRVIERQLLNKIISEQNLSLTGVIDQKSVEKLGKILGVEAIVTGTVTDLYETLRINARMISTETGEIFAVAATKIVKDVSVKFLLSDNSKRTREKIENAEQNIVELNGLKFKPMQGKRKDNGRLVATIQIINTTESQKRAKFTFENSQLYDNLGNQYSTELRIGSSTSRWSTFGYDDYSINQMFIPDVPVNMQITSTKPAPEKVTEITVSLTVLDWEVKPTIKNIPVSP